MEVTLFLEYKQASLTIDLSAYADRIVERMASTLQCDFTDGHLHRFYLHSNKMRQVITSLTAIKEVSEMFEHISVSMRKLDGGFNLSHGICTAKSSVFTIDRRS